MPSTDHGILFASSNAVRITRISYTVTIMLICYRGDDSQGRTDNLTYLLLLCFSSKPHSTTPNSNFPLTRSTYHSFDFFTPYELFSISLSYLPNSDVSPWRLWRLWLRRRLWPGVWWPSIRWPVRWLPTHSSTDEVLRRMVRIPEPLGGIYGSALLTLPQYARF
jgi:hypothetical protein